LYKKAKQQNMEFGILPTYPATIDEKWNFLGYDVAEITLLSGLMSMGYHPEEKETGKSLFASQINNYHLFDNIDVAKEFARWNLTIDTGHSPYYVHGLCNTL